MTKFWLSDFEFSDGTVLVKKTGHQLPLNGALVNDVLTWMSFYSLAQGWRLWRRVTGHRRPRIAFLPDAPRPWYFVWPVLHAAGAIIEKDPERADIIFHFNDATLCEPAIPSELAHKNLLNFKCRDISKSTVAAAFQQATGRALAVDPRTHDGPMVEKSELNGAHDGRIVEGPREPLADKTYQRVVDNTIDGGMVEDLRCTCVAGKPILVLRKRRQQARRFANENSEVVLADPASCFTAAEMDEIRRFTQVLGLDWGGIDVLRDAGSGEIYFVDANKTDMGPPVALSLGEKLRATRRMARAFVAAYVP